MEQPSATIVQKLEARIQQLESQLHNEQLVSNKKITELALENENLRQ